MQRDSYSRNKKEPELSFRRILTTVANNHRILDGAGPKKSIFPIRRTSYYKRKTSLGSKTIFDFDERSAFSVNERIWSNTRINFLLYEVLSHLKQKTDGTVIITKKSLLHFSLT